jgi:hypothetical protein
LLDEDVKDSWQRFITQCKNGWRDLFGRFVKPESDEQPGEAAELAARPILDARPGWKYLASHVYVRNSKGVLRIYDYVYEVTEEDGKNEISKEIGVEVKSGDTPLTAGQREFDNDVSLMSAANGVGKSAGYTIVGTEIIRIP